MKRKNGILAISLICIIAGIVLEAIGIDDGSWGEILVMLGGFGALWYRLGRIEGRFEEHLRKHP